MSINVLPSPPIATDLKYVVVGVPSVPAFSGSAGTVTVNHNQGRTPIGYSMVLPSGVSPTQRDIILQLVADSFTTTSIRFLNYNSASGACMAVLYFS